jgi:hypothetical protein
MQLVDPVCGRKNIYYKTRIRGDTQQHLLVEGLASPPAKVHATGFVQEANDDQ